MIPKLIRIEQYAVPGVPRCLIKADCLESIDFWPDSKQLAFYCTSTHFVSVLCAADFADRIVDAVESFLRSDQFRLLIICINATSYSCKSLP